MHENENTRIASSHLVTELYGDISKYQKILAAEKARLTPLYNDPTLNPLINAIDTRVINICPMVLCDALLTDLRVPCPDSLLAGLGLAMFSISTHDDVVDELPRDRETVASLIYAGNIVTLEGIKLLIKAGHHHVVPVLIENLNQNHYYQTKIVNTLWTAPSTENEYIQAIKHTGYWTAIGLHAAIAYIHRPDLAKKMSTFAMCYGLACQIVDDMREIPDDRKNGYWSLPMSIAHANSLDLDKPENMNFVITRPRDIACEQLRAAKEITDKNFPTLLELASKLERVVKKIAY